MKTSAILAAGAVAALAGAEAWSLPDDAAHIVNGVATQNADYPWIVSLSTRGATGSSFCGGSLIAPNVVLTAAHCIFTNAASITVRVKGAGTTVFTGGEQIPAAQAIRHPQYNSGTQDNDVAIIIMSANSAVTPIKIDDGTAPMTAYDGQDVRAIGWGTTSSGGQAPRNLLQVTVPVVPTAICNAAPAYPGQITDNMICAGLKAGGKDSCQGDSGGPLIRKTGNDELLVAAVSWGVGCASPNKYGVYARIKTTLPFIRQYVKADVGAVATAAPVAGPQPPAPPLPPPAAEQVCRCSGCKGKYEVCGKWDLNVNVCLLEDPSTDPAVAPNCKAIPGGQIRYSNNFKQYYMTGCVEAGLGGANANSVMAQGLQGMALVNGEDRPNLAGSGDEGSNFVKDVLPILGAVAGTGFVVAGVVAVAMKKNRSEAPRTFSTHSNKMGYAGYAAQPPSARTMQL
jgi:trypsin